MYDVGMNRAVAAGATFGGVALIVGGLAIAGFSSDSLSAVLINGGVALALFALLLLLERRLMSRAADVASSTAEATVERNTKDLRDRIVKLENLDDAQVEARAQRRLAEERLVERLSTEVLTTDVVGSLLVEAYNDGLFADDRTFRVRTSDRADCQVLYMLPMKDPTKVPILFFDFEPFLDDDRPMVLDSGTQMTVPAGGPTTCCFSITDDAGKMAGELEAALTKANKPTNGFSLQYALNQLVSSVQVMRRARAAESGSPLRMQGRLRLLINDEWGITDAGLEAVAEPKCFETRVGGFWATGGVSPFSPSTVSLSGEMSVRDDADWLATRDWLTQREHWKLEYREAS